MLTDGRSVAQAVEEKRARYEEELGRVNDMLTESENRRQLMLKETDTLNKEVRSAFQLMLPCVRASVYVGMYICMYMRTFMYIRTYVRTVRT